MVSHGGRLYALRARTSTLKPAVPPSGFLSHSIVCDRLPVASPLPAGPPLRWTPVQKNGVDAMPAHINVCAITFKLSGAACPRPLERLVGPVVSVGHPGKH